METAMSPSGRVREPKPVVSLTILTVLLLVIGMAIGIGIGQQLAPRPTPVPDVNIPANWTVTIRNPEVTVTNWPPQPSPDTDGDGVPDAYDDVPESPLWSKKIVVAQDITLPPGGTYSLFLMPSHIVDVVFVFESPARAAFGYSSPGCNAMRPQLEIGPTDVTYAAFIMPYKIDGVCEGLAKDIDGDGTIDVPAQSFAATFYLTEIGVENAVRILRVEALA